MAKNKYKVETPYGTFTRATDRTYTHIVLVCGRPAGWLELRHQWHIENQTKQYNKYSKVVETGELPAGYQGCTLEKYAKWADGCKAELENCPVQHAAELEANQKAITDKLFHCETWCGRHDLALKAAAKLRKDYALVEIVAI